MREWGHGGCLRFPDFLPLPMSPPRGGDGNLGPAWKTPPLGLGPGHCLAWQPPWPGHRARSASAPGGCCRPCRPSPSLAQQDRKPGVSSPWKSPRVARATTRPPPQWVARGPMGTCGGRGSEQESPSPLTWHSGLGGCWGGGVGGHLIPPPRTQTPGEAPSQSPGRARVGARTDTPHQLPPALGGGPGGLIWGRPYPASLQEPCDAATAVPRALAEVKPPPLARSQTGPRGLCSAFGV